MKGQLVEVIKRKVTIDKISSVSLRCVLTPIMSNGIVVGANAPTMKAFISCYIQKAFEVETFAITMCEELCFNTQQDRSEIYSKSSLYTIVNHVS